MSKKQHGTFQLLALCAVASSMGIHIGLGRDFSPAYFWLTIALFALQSAGVWLLSRSFERCGSPCAAHHLSRLLSPAPARILLGMLGVLLTLRSAIALTLQTDCVALYLLEDTPGFAVMLVLLLTAFAALLPGLRRLAGVSTLLVLLLPLMLLFITAPGLLGADFGRMRVLLHPMPEEFLPAFVNAALTASGAECTLFFLGGRRWSGSAAAGAAAAPAVCAAVFAALSLTAVGTIGQGGMSSVRFPLVEASRQISLGSIELTERFDLPVITAGLFASTAQISVFTLCSAEALCSAFGSERIGTAAGVLLGVQFCLALLLQYTAADGIIMPLCAVGLTFFSVIVFPLAALIAAAGRREAAA